MAGSLGTSALKEGQTFSLDQWRTWPEEERWELIGGVADSSETVVQPDVLVICDQNKIKEDGIYGAPDFIAEMLSPSTAYKDMSVKLKLYEHAGVREYWMVNPDTGSVFRYALKDAHYGAATEILRGRAVESAIFQGFIWKVQEPGK